MLPHLGTRIREQPNNFDLFGRETTTYTTDRYYLFHQLTPNRRLDVLQYSYDDVDDNG